MKTYNEQEAMQGVAQRFVQVAEELRLTGPQLFREGIVANDQVLSKIKKGWQQPTKKAIELFCKAYGVSVAWMYTGEGQVYLNRDRAFEHRAEVADEKVLYSGDFNACLNSEGETVPTGADSRIVFPTAGDIDFWCVNNDKSLSPVIMPGDTIALKKLNTWREFIPGDFICVVVTKEYKVLRKVSVMQGDDQSINFIQMVDGKPVEARIPKDIIIEVYKVVGNYRKQ